MDAQLSDEKIEEIKSTKFVVKERFGSGSNKVGINLTKNKAIIHAKKLNNPIFQPYFKGTEFSVDLYVGKNRKVKGCIVRKRNLIVNGEAQISETVKNSKIERICIQIVEALKFFGHIVIQIIIDKNNQIHIIECNCRFGGASTLSIEMGLDSFYWFLLETQKIKLEKSELKDKIKLELNREMAQKINEVKERIIKNESEKVELNLIEKEKLIEQLRNDLKETQRRAEQGSVQAQGEAQEIGIEDYLKDTFPMDSIEEIKKGARGADCLQIINTPGREACGSIYYESKRTKKFGGDWVEKFRNDMREKGGVSVGILVTEAMPNDMPKMGMRNGIWICNYTEFKGLSIALRESVIQLSSAVVSQENKGGKMTMVYDYLISNEFKMIIESIVEAYSDMKSDLEREKRSLQGHWKRREKQIERVSVNVIDMYSSLKGLAGNSVQSVDALDYENMESEVYDLEEKLEIKTSVN